MHALIFNQKSLFECIKKEPFLKKIKTKLLSAQSFQSYYFKVHNFFKNLIYDNDLREALWKNI